MTNTARDRASSRAGRMVRRPALWLGIRIGTVRPAYTGRFDPSGLSTGQSQLAKRSKRGLDRWTGSWVLAIALVGTATGHLLGALSRHRLRRQLYAPRCHATHDALTGLANRFAAYAALDMARSKGEQISVAMMIDVDSLEFVNDFHGRDSGDLVLRHVAAKLGASFNTGLAARLGGDEVLLVLPGGKAAAHDAAHRAAERISHLPSNSATTPGPFASASAWPPPAGKPASTTPSCSEPPRIL